MISHREFQLLNDFSSRVAQFEEMTDDYKENKVAVGPEICFLYNLIPISFRQGVFDW